MQANWSKANFIRHSWFDHNKWKSRAADWRSWGRSYASFDWATFGLTECIKLTHRISLGESYRRAPGKPSIRKTIACRCAITYHFLTKIRSHSTLCQWRSEINTFTRKKYVNMLKSECRNVTTTEAIKESTPYCNSMKTLSTNIQSIIRCHHNTKKIILHQLKIPNYLPVFCRTSVHESNKLKHV